MQQLREEGVENLELVHHAIMEGDSEISAIKKEEAA